MDYGKIIFEELNQWVYNDENQAGQKLQIIDASDLPEIITEIVKKLNIPDVSDPVLCECGQDADPMNYSDCCSYPCWAKKYDL